ncbi:MAG: GatB/YqeY domain-containing protein [Acidobacteriia bacterium]|nr:GatB/YqeY domain-containing protein [Terriglobia bacterium]
MHMTLKERITEDMKVAMRAKETARLSAVRLLLAAIKQREVDERITLTNAEHLRLGGIDQLLIARYIEPRAQFLSLIPIKDTQGYADTCSQCFAAKHAARREVERWVVRPPYGERRIR